MITYNLLILLDFESHMLICLVDFISVLWEMHPLLLALVLTLFVRKANSCRYCIVFSFQCDAFSNTTITHAKSDMVVSKVVTFWWPSFSSSSLVTTITRHLTLSYLMISIATSHSRNSHLAHHRSHQHQIKLHILQLTTVTTLFASQFLDF